MGLTKMFLGDYQKATQHMEEFYKLSANRSWLNESGVTHMLSACRHLSRSGLLLCSLFRVRVVAVLLVSAQVT